MKMRREERQYLLGLQGGYLKFTHHPILEKYHKKALNDLIHRDMDLNFPIISRRYILLYILGCLSMIDDDDNEEEEKKNEYIISNLFGNVPINISEYVLEKSKFMKPTLLNLCNRRGPIDLVQRCRCVYYLMGHQTYTKNVSKYELLEMNKEVWKEFCDRFDKEDWVEINPVISVRHIKMLKDMIDDNL